MNTEPREPNAAGTPAPVVQIPTRAQLAETRRRREEEGFLFPLSATSRGGPLLYARVRFPSLADRAFLNQLPSNLQRLLAEQLASETPSGRKKRADDVAEMSGAELTAFYIDLAGSQDDLAQRTMALCWIDPRVARFPDDLDPTDQHQVLAEDIHIDDRVQYISLCMSGEGEAAQWLADFHRRPVGAVPAEPHLETTTAPEPSTGYAEPF